MLRTRTVLASAVALLLIRLLLHRVYFRRGGKLVPGSIAVITGGGSGIGLEFARLFARAGCHVVLVGRNVANLRAAQASCLSLGAPTAEYVVADLATVEGTTKVGDVVRERHGALRYLVLNAGAGAIAAFSSDPSFTDNCDKMMQINYFSNVRLLQQLLPLLENTNSATAPSRIIVLSSLAGVLPSIYRSAYTASKHAIQGFMNAVRGETAVSITLCCPGYVDTDFHQRAQLAGNFAASNTRRGVPAQVCAQVCLDGALRGDSEVITTVSGKLGYILRPIFTKFIDAQVKRVSLHSLQR
ncbi:short-chain dehydrogenase [Trypanosoma rangeli]|uniref:Short-chain dehydrogenase n=1 Tax=Trypanosoma rangeli TaxID=5698 RepID=A0A3S5IS03_TRYRA|nr:short-chain dehydrogenase [Trypanosoma rangeli]RNF09495.1 short-chain dehydrogenase [Trypanosoma rangeli]|eukprot:RNF09495.1 short-chain dehydrogenase [Trypanosoma rangeli]